MDSFRGIITGFFFGFLFWPAYGMWLHRRERLRVARERAGFEGFLQTFGHGVAAARERLPSQDMPQA